MLALLVTSAKLAEVTTLAAGIGLLSFVLLVISLLIINANISMHDLWNSYHNDQATSIKKASPLYGCLTCGAAVDSSTTHCPRCNKKIEPRIKHSLKKTGLLLLAAAILYIPALTLPIMTMTSFGYTSSTTILSGVVHLFQDGMWFIALVVFVVSVLVPLLKLFILGYVLLSVYYQHQKYPRLRLSLYKFTKIIGRWSMVDIFVIALLATLVQFGIVVKIQPQIGAAIFATVVVLTIAAAKAFDSRLIWDALNIPLKKPTDAF